MKYPAWTIQAGNQSEIEAFGTILQRFNKNIQLESFSFETTKNILYANLYFQSKGLFKEIDAHLMCLLQKKEVDKAELFTMISSKFGTFEQFLNLDSL